MIELLSPAGDLEKLKIAFLYGADACYIGGKKYSLRANASNFDEKDLKEAVDFAHNLGKKIYVTCNIVFHNEDLDGLLEYLKYLEKIKVDAIIVSDPLVIDLVNDNNIDLEIHLSTQNCTTNIESVKYFLSKGVKRIVLAREVGKCDIERIIKETGADIEVFLHGAMCTCYSGRCALSNYFTLRDSNRGGCAQVCRFTFDLDKKRETDYSIATCDLALGSAIPDLINIGVKSIKVEGRMRSSYYIATVISCYRKLIDAYYNNSFDEKLLERVNKVLDRVANRRSTTQYFYKEANKDDQYYVGRKEESNQDFLGVIKGYDHANKMLIIEQRNYFKIGDTINIFTPSGKEYNIEVKKLYTEDLLPLECARHPREIIKIPYENEIDVNSYIRVTF